MHNNVHYDRNVHEHNVHNEHYEHNVHKLCLTLNYHMFNLIFIYFTCYIAGMFQNKFPFIGQ